MSLLLARIDDRLVHGQVVVGCCEPLKAARILLCDDAVAADAMLRGLFGLATPVGVELEVRGVAATPARLGELEATGEDASTILLVAHSTVMLQLVEAGARIDEVNLGGVHAGAEGMELWPGFFVGAADRAALQTLVESGVRVLVQSVPGASCIDASPRLRASTR